jgi:hypothetical protein
VKFHTSPTRTAATPRLGEDQQRPAEVGVEAQFEGPDHHVLQHQRTETGDREELGELDQAHPLRVPEDEVVVEQVGDAHPDAHRDGIAHQVGESEPEGEQVEHHEVECGVEATGDQEAHLTLPSR